jgi:hypothetical protein
VLEYTYRRSTGKVMGSFLTALRDGRIVGSKTKAGRVLVPPSEYDPETGASLDDEVAVADAGVVTTWSWVTAPRPAHPLPRPFAWALVKLDGADTPMLHAVDVASMAAMKTGMRVKARWSPSRTGSIRDIVCFEPEAT